MVVFADWANLPFDVCKRILCTDVETFFVGPRVCEGWNKVRYLGDLKLKRFDLGDDKVEQTPTVFCRVTPTYRNVTYATAVADVLQRHGSYLTEELVISDRGMEEISLDIREQIQGLYGLRNLRLYAGGYGLIDYAQLCIIMPLSLTTLEIEIKVAEPPSPMDGSLDVFNRLHRLESLSVSCTYAKYCGACRLPGDLELPCLQKLELSVTRRASIIACDLSFSKIPDSCSVICELEVETESAKHRLQA